MTKTSRKTAGRIGGKDSTFRSILLPILVFSFTAIITLTVFLTANYAKSMVDLVKNYNDNLLAQTNYSINRLNSEAARLKKALFSDNNISSYLYMKKYDPTTVSLASQAIHKQLITLPNVNGIYLYNQTLDLYYVSSTGEQLYGEALSNPFLRKHTTDPEAASYAQEPIVAASSGSDSQDPLLYFFWFDSYQNAIAVSVRPSILTESIRAINRSEKGLITNFVILDRDGSPVAAVLTPGLSGTEELFSQLSGIVSEMNGNGGSSTLRLDGTEYFLTFSQDNDNSWYLSSFLPKKMIYSDAVRTGVIGGLIMIVFLLVCSLISFNIARKLNTPIAMIADLVSGKNKGTTPFLPSTREFRTILDSYSTLQKNVENLNRLKRETKYSVKQDCLNSLLTGNRLIPQETLLKTLNNLKLSYLADSLLAMTVLKIDRYDQVLQENNPEELWVLRFAVVNIAEELALQTCRCTVFSQEDDKFVLLLECEEELPYSQFEARLTELSRKIQENVSKFLQLSLTVAYSTRFRGIASLPSMYQSLLDNLLLKLKYGHGSIISPDMASDSDFEVFHFPTSKVQNLILAINDGKSKDALEIYQTFAEQLFDYDYNEVMAALNRLIYRINTDVYQKYPDLKETFTGLLKNCLHAVQHGETSEELNAAVDSYISGICQQISSHRSAGHRQNSEVLVEKILAIVEENFQDTSLCLSSIAEMLGRSPNYIGKIFRNATQKSVAQYISEYRLEKLAEYLKTTTLSVSSILEKVGIEKNNYFYTLFKKYFGMSLNEYRAQINEEKNRKQADE